MTYNIYYSVGFFRREFPLRNDPPAGQQRNAALLPDPWVGLCENLGFQRQRREM